MVKNQWKNILEGQEIRQSLSKIRQAIKEKSNFQQLQSLVEDNEGTLIKLLESEDAKTRKNAALLMGDLGQQLFLEPVWQAYINEQQRFVKSSYLLAVGKLDYSTCLAEIKEQLEILKSTELTSENEKHIIEEMRELTALVVGMEGMSKHPFCGWNATYNVVLLANRNCTELVGRELLELEPNAEIKPVGAGIMAKVENLNWVRQLRIYQELLFMVKGLSACPMEPAAVAEMIAHSQLIEFLAGSHEGSAPYYFRLEMKSKKSLGEKSVFLKKLAGQIEKLTGRQLINSTDNYEVEIRLIENKQQNCNILIKLFTITDKRFNYRLEFMPSSIKPVNAALAVSLASEYMKEDAQVMDPFCGVGTMLIERHKAVRANTMYGIDIQEEAIVKAGDNTAEAHQIIHYINRDFFRFTHEYLFDEIITDMPFKIGRTAEEEIMDIYKRFFRKIPQHLNEGALVVLYSHNKDLVKKMTPWSDFRLLKEYEISKREETYVFILRYK